MQATKRSKRRARKPPNELERIVAAEKFFRKSTSRFRHYPYLEEVYRTYWRWKKDSTARRSSRALAIEVQLSVRVDAHPIRVLIDLTHDGGDSKIVSRWVRALEYAAAKNIRPSFMRTFLRTRGGISGCARRASEKVPRRRFWDDAEEHFFS